MKTQIKVTSDCIDAGERLSAFGCPVALAIQAYLKPTARAGVGRVGIGFYSAESQKSVSVGVLDAVVKFIVAFDGGGEVAPFSFDLDIPAAFLK